jgi:hypothetical protein
VDRVEREADRVGRSARWWVEREADRLEDQARDQEGPGDL